MAEKDFCAGSIVDNTIKAILDDAIFPNFGKNLKDGDSEKKDGENEGLWAAVEAQAAFLGPNIWDKNLACDADLKVGAQYVDLDEFLSENGIPLDQPSPPQNAMTPSPSTATTGGGEEGGGSLRRVETKRERSVSPYDAPLSPSTLGPPSPSDSTMSFSSTAGREFDPRTRAFSDEELKPQPMVKKSRKQFVPDDLKDEKYWARRKKNNLAAKRSRDARRVKENQIALRAGFLEKENLNLKLEVERLKKENSSLKNKLDKAAKSN